jgi:branched-chain amino acid transport system ATP-binding protein
MLTLSHIEAFYKKVQVLWDVSFIIEEKEIVTLVGSNGAGKTTVLNTISGLLHPASGTVEFLGRRIDRMPPYRMIELCISHIPEGGQSFPEMTVRENLELGAYIPRVQKERQASLEWVYEMFPVLRERSKQLAKNLSGGERQMLAIGRGLMSKPRLCMLDEPSYGLAPLLVGEIFRIIGVLNEQGTTLLLVEQNVKHTLEIAHRAYLLESGRIVLEGTCESFLQNGYVRQAYLGL